MDIIGGIAAATEGLKLVNELRKIDREVDKAELKLRLVELADKLVDAKQALQVAQDNELALRKEINGLTSKIEQRARMQDENGLLYELDGAGGRIGAPFCNHCYIKEEKLFRLRHFEAKQGMHSHFRCDHCNVTIITGPGLPTKRTQGRDSWMRR